MNGDDRESRVFEKELGTGDKAPKGTYYCEHCQVAYEHPGGDEPLPRCPKSQIWTLFTKKAS